jgi:hypothetical protein
MARIRSFSLILCFLTQLLFSTSEAYRHRHLRRTYLYRSRTHAVESTTPQVVDAEQQTIAYLKGELDSKLALRDTVIKVLYRGTRPVGERCGGDSQQDDQSNGNSDDTAGDPSIDDLRQQLDDIKQTLQSLQELLSSSLGISLGTSTSRAMATSTSSYTLSNATSSDSRASPSTASTRHPLAASTSPSSSTSASQATSASTSTSSATSHSATTTISPRTPTPQTSTSNRYIFDPLSSSNVAVYYGQTDMTSTVPLTTVCSDPNVDIIILAFVNKLSTGPAGYPTLNMGAKCWAATSAQISAGATGLIDCVGDGFASQVQACQGMGKKVMLSIGGAVGYSETTIANEGDAVRIADNIWNLFGAGGLDDPTIMPMRPFGNVVFDGFDIGELPFRSPIPLTQNQANAKPRQRKRPHNPLAPPNLHPPHPPPNLHPAVRPTLLPLRNPPVP